MLNIIHARYLNDAYLKILSFKALLKFLEDYQIKNDINRIIILKKHMVLTIFGFSFRHPCYKAGYLLSYTAYALALGVEDSKPLTSYGKNYMLAHREGEQKTNNNVFEHVLKVEKIDR